LSVALGFGIVALVPQVMALRLWGVQQGYEPPQPIAFSHRLHAGEMQISCLYCHSAAESSRHAGIPAASTCMNCHQFVTAPLGMLRAEDEQAAKEKRKPRRIVSAELQKLYDALALNENQKRDPAKTPQPIQWNRVHRLPDYVYFDHRAHTGAGVACQTCHGAVETMDVVRQVPDLTMGWCVNCHREADTRGVATRPVKPSVDCATCHY
jgi:hypothetical protein